MQLFNSLILAILAFMVNYLRFLTWKFGFNYLTFVYNKVKIQFN